MIQCQGYTKSGQRCRKRTRDPNNKCHIHMSQQTLSDGDDEVIITRIVPPQTQSAQSAPRVSQRIQTRSVTRMMIEVALQNYRDLVDDNFEENVDRLIELELERERIIQEMRVREPPRRPRKPVKRAKKEEIESEESLLDYKGNTEDCCICMDCKVKDVDFLECKHAVCKGCVKNLRDPRCPMCRADIKARFITDKDRRAMKAKERQDKADRANEAFRNYMTQERITQLYANL